MTTPRLEHVRSRLERWSGAGQGADWVVAVSGGSDSVGLLRILHQLAPELGLRLVVAHLDHGVRGEAARADTAFVAALAESLGLPFVLGRWQPERAGHFESDARTARYAWLVETARARGAGVVAVGHTRDDQAETILHRLVRGTGLHGLAGMPARRPLDEAVTLIRPLLSATRQEIRAFLDDLGQPYREDASNADLSQTRARIRHDLLPKLAAEYNPRVADALVRLGALAAGSERALRRQVRVLERTVIVSVERQRIVVKREALATAPRLLRAEVLRRAWRQAGWPEAAMTARRWRRLARLVKAPGTRATIGAGVEAVADPAHLILERAGESSGAWLVPIPEEPVPLGVPGTAAWGPGLVTATLDPNVPRDESIDLDRLEPPLTVRVAVPGDRFAPLGMSGHSTPLNDFLRARRIPKAERGRIPLVCDRIGIVWVAGHRITERVRLTEGTQRIVGLRWKVNREV